MPLSEREQQILKEIERDLLADRPDHGEAEPRRTRGSDQIKGGLLLFVVGIVCLGFFFVTGALVLGLAAFAAMVSGLVLIANGARDAAERNFRDLSSGGAQDLFGRWEERLRNRNNPRS